MSGYTKLFNSIIASTIWSEPDTVRIVWITLLAMVDRTGLVETSIPGLAVLARVSQDDCEKAIAVLEGPDKYSRNQHWEGRRIKKVDGGWMILNYALYRAKLSADERREYFRIKKREQRDKMSNNVKDVKDKSHLSHIAEADADAEATTSKSIVRQQAPDAPSFESFIEVYPRPEKKLDARKAWERIPLGERSAVLAGLADWIGCDQWQDKQYVPLPATFLRAKQWNDSPIKFGGSGGKNISANQQRSRNTLEAARRVLARTGDEDTDSVRPALPNRT